MSDPGMFKTVAPNGRTVDALKCVDAPCLVIILYRQVNRSGKTCRIWLTKGGTF